jgi:hypothetical protein
MSIQDRVSADAPPILRLGDLPEIERRVIRLLRLWRDGPAGRTEARILAGDAACLWLDGLLRLLAAPAARPLHVSAPAFSSVLGDEAVFARAVSSALEGPPQEAALTCALLAPAATAQGAARLAGELGRALLAAPGMAIPPRTYLIAGRPVTPRGVGAR